MATSLKWDRRSEAEWRFALDSDRLFLPLDLDEDLELELEDEVLDFEDEVDARDSDDEDLELNDDDDDAEDAREDKHEGGDDATRICDTSSAMDWLGGKAGRLA